MYNNKKKNSNFLKKCFYIDVKLFFKNNYLIKEILFNLYSNFSLFFFIISKKFDTSPNLNGLQCL